MKKIMLLAAGTVCAAAVLAHVFAFGAMPTPRTDEGPAFAWTVTLFDFGKIKQSKPVTHEFTFTNSGDVPLVISSVQASCGCTVAEYSKEPIPAGGQGFVKATYNAAKTGVFTKTITINSNTAEPVLLTIKGEVVE